MTAGALSLGTIVLHCGKASRASMKRGLFAKRSFREGWAIEIVMQIGGGCAGWHTSWDVRRARIERGAGAEDRHQHRGSLFSPGARDNDIPGSVPPGAS